MLKLICNPKSILVLILVVLKHSQNGKTLDMPISAGVQQGDTLPSCFNFHIVNSVHFMDSSMPQFCIFVL